MQDRTPSAAKALIEPLAARTGWSVGVYDGHVEFLVSGVEDFVRAAQDPEYPARTAVDERFLDHERTLVMLGWEEVYGEGGRVVLRQHEADIYRDAEGEEERQGGRRHRDSAAALEELFKWASTLRYPPYRSRGSVSSLLGMSY